jgi:coenzyme F420-reducing hydrogenase delta subunit
MCTGTVDPVLLVQALKMGADGVFVGGCRLGDCHYIDGNYFAQWKVRITRECIAKAGLGRDRLDIQFMSSAEGERYVTVMNTFIEGIKKLGPSPVRSKERNESMMFHLEAVQQVLLNFRFRALIGKFRKVSEGENVYGEKIPQDRIETLLQETIDAEYLRSCILLLMKEKPWSVTELSQKLEETPERILEQVTFLRSKNLIDFKSLEGRSPLYSYT